MQRKFPSRKHRVGPLSEYLGTDTPIVTKITGGQIAKAIRNLTPGTAPGPDGFHAEHLRMTLKAQNLEIGKDVTNEIARYATAFGAGLMPSVGNTIGPRNAPNPARPAFPRPEAGALYPPDIGSTRPGPDYSTTRPARESPARESPELPRFQVRILQSPLFFLFGGPSPVGSAVGCLSEQRTKPHKTRQAGCEFPAQVSGLSLW